MIWIYVAYALVGVVVATFFRLDTGYDENSPFMIALVVLSVPLWPLFIVARAPFTIANFIGSVRRNNY